jgi:hypothetical protein
MLNAMMNEQSQISAEQSYASATSNRLRSFTPNKKKGAGGQSSSMTTR